MTDFLTTWGKKKWRLMMITRLLSFKYETMQSTVIFRFKPFSYINNSNFFKWCDLCHQRCDHEAKLINVILWCHSPSQPSLLCNIWKLVQRKYSFYRKLKPWHIIVLKVIHHGPITKWKLTVKLHAPSLNPLLSYLCPPVNFKETLIERSHSFSELTKNEQTNSSKSFFFGGAIC